MSSLKPPIDLLKSIFTHLELKGQAFDLYEATTEDENLRVLISATID